MKSHLFLIHQIVKDCIGKSMGQNTVDEEVFLAMFLYFKFFKSHTCNLANLVLCTYLCDNEDGYTDIHCNIGNAKKKKGNIYG